MEKDPIVLPNQIEPANIDPRVRPMIFGQEDDGYPSYSTVYSSSFTDKDGKQVLVPGVIPDEHGKYYKASFAQAKAHYEKTGEHLGKFSKIDDNNDPGQILHEKLAAEYQAKYGDLNELRPVMQNPNNLDWGIPQAPDIGTTKGYGPNHRLIPSLSPPRSIAMPMSPDAMFGQFPKVMQAGQPMTLAAPPQQALGGMPPPSLTTQQMLALHQTGQAAPVQQQQQQQQQQQTGAVPPPGDPNAPPTDMGQDPGSSSITGMAPGQATFNAALNQHAAASQRQQNAEANYNQGIDQEQQGLAAQGAAQQDLNQVAADKGAGMQAIDGQREKVASAYEDKRAQLMAQFDKQNTAQLQKMQAAVDAATSSSVHNFWQDKSTGARILGIIAQALSGAANGLSGNPGAPTALDRVINDDLQQQMANQQNKRQAAQQQQSMYDTMLRATGNRLDAETAMRQAANDHVTAMAQTLADKMAIPQAAAQAKMIAADMQQKNAQLLEKRSAQQGLVASQDANYALNQMGDAEKLGVVANSMGAKAAAKAPGDGQYYALPGAMDGLVKAKTTSAIYNKQSKAAGDLVSYLTTLEHAKTTIGDGSHGLDAYYKIADDGDIAFSKIRSDAMEALGHRLEGSEGDMAQRGSVSYLKSFVGSDPLKANLAIQNLQDGWGRVLLDSYRSANPNMALNFNAPVIGPIFHRLVSQENDRNAKRAQQQVPHGQPAQQ